MASTKKTLTSQASSAKPARGYDVFGNIAVVKFRRDVNVREKKAWALEFLKGQKQIQTVLEKTDKFKGRLRVQKTKHLVGLKTKEALYKENGCIFRLNVDTCYFSPRLAAERKEVAGMIGKGESVLVMFGGVGPFAIVIAKLAKPRRIVSVELGKEPSAYALENVKRNKIAVEIVQGDVHKRVPKLNEKFDRIIMARPNLKDSFLDVAFDCVEKGGIIQYYGFYEEEKLEEMKTLIEVEAKKAGKNIRIMNVKKAGDIGVRKFRYRADIRVLN